MKLYNGFETPGIGCVAKQN